MTKEKIQMFMMQNQNKFEATKIPFIAEKLEQMEDENFMFLSSAEYKDPNTMLIISLFLGGLGVDRFMLGDVGIGVLKLLTAGCFGVLTIIDWFNIKNKTYEFNFDVFMKATETQATFSYGSSSVEEIKKYKGLLDSGVISMEEFEEKKKELL